MTVRYHPDFPQDIKKYETQYKHVSSALGARFRAEVQKAIDRIKSSPASAGHFLNTGSKIVKEVRLRNLASFPFFIFLYGMSDDVLVFRSLIPSASDPLTWLKR